MLLEVIEEAAHKVIVFVPYVHTIDLVSEKLTLHGITNEIIYGDVPVKQRTHVFNKFQTETNPRVLIIQPVATAHGVTLTAADTIVWWGPIMSVEIYKQANDRIHRIGQDNPCTVVHLQSGGAEKQVYKMLEGKIDTHTQIVELYKNILTER